MECCHLPRRQAVRWGGLVAATPLASGAAYAEPSAHATTAYAEPSAHAATADVPIQALLVQDLEVVTVTDTSVVVTWFTGSAAEGDRYGRPAPVPTDTELLLGEPGQPATLHTVLHTSTPTAYHYAEVGGLEPCRTYLFQARSAGQVAVSTSLQFPSGSGGSLDAPGLFTTLRTPPGRYLFTLALAGDTHIGETISGTIVGSYPPSFQQDQGLPPYPEFMLSALLVDLRRPDRSAHALLVAGDLTAEATPPQVTRARELLDGWGRLGTDYLVARGNHDRPHVGAAYMTGSAVPSAPDHHDCWGDTFGYPWQTLHTGQLGGLRLVGLDTTTLDQAGGTLGDGQLADLRHLLHRDRDRPTLVFGHHPVTWEAAVTTVAGPAFNLDQTQARKLEALYATAPGVFLHHAGHTHRNKRTYALDNHGVEFLEVAATKEYPGGYSLLRVYTGGYLASFYKTRTDLARQWSQRTRAEYFGLYPAYTLGTLADRNHTVVRELSGLAPA
jgi:hypothetical protein